MFGNAIGGQLPLIQNYGMTDYGITYKQVVYID